jgi:hypothetical protein
MQTSGPLLANFPSAHVEFFGFGERLDRSEFTAPQDAASSTYSLMSPSTEKTSWE